MSIEGTGKYFLERPEGNIEATAEQEAILDAVRASQDNVCINALAGAAKSKGLEFDHIFFLDSWRIRKDLIGEPLEQERNLEYVIMTRAKRTLTYIESENFHVGD